MKWQVFWLSVLFWIVETNYFGWNFTPQSSEEVICDGIVLLIAALSFKEKKE